LYSLKGGNRDKFLFGRLKRFWIWGLSTASPLKKSGNLDRQRKKSLAFLWWAVSVYLLEDMI
jgi:hypothetical protein